MAEGACGMSGPVATATFPEGATGMVQNMNLRINGKGVSLPVGQTVPEYLAARGLDPQAVIIEINEAIIPRDKWPGLALKEGDRLEVVSFVGGG